MKEKINRVSVIVVTRNRPIFLTKLLFSLQEQVRKPYEIIIVVNSSGVGEEQDVINKFSSLHPILRISRSGGIPTARNIGIKNATGDIIAFIDDDCIAEKKWVNNILKFHNKFNSINIIQGSSKSIPSNNIFAKISGIHYTNWLHANSISTNKLNTFDTKNLSFKKVIFRDKNNIFDERIKYGSDDIEFGIRLQRAGQSILFVPSIKILHRERITLFSFIVQHVRFAMGEGELNNYVPTCNRVGVLPLKKIVLHILSFFSLELRFLKDLRIDRFLLLPIIIITLFIVRLIGYHFGRILTGSTKNF